MLKRALRGVFILIIPFLSLFWLEGNTGASGPQTTPKSKIKTDFEKCLEPLSNDESKGFMPWWLKFRYCESAVKQAKNNIEYIEASYQVMKISAILLEKISGSLMFAEVQTVPLSLTCMLYSSWFIQGYQKIAPKIPQDTQLAEEVIKAIFFLTICEYYLGTSTGLKTVLEWGERGQKLAKIIGDKQKQNFFNSLVTEVRHLLPLVQKYEILSKNKQTDQEKNKLTCEEVRTLIQYFSRINHPLSILILLEQNQNCFRPFEQELIKAKTNYILTKGMLSHIGIEYKELLANYFSSKHIKEKNKETNKFFCQKFSQIMSEIEKQRQPRSGWSFSKSIEHAKKALQLAENEDEIYKAMLWGIAAAIDHTVLWSNAIKTGEENIARKQVEKGLREIAYFAKYITKLKKQNYIRAIYYLVKNDSIEVADIPEAPTIFSPLFIWPTNCPAGKEINNKFDIEDLKTEILLPIKKIVYKTTAERVPDIAPEAQKLLREIQNKPLWRALQKHMPKSYSCYHRVVNNAVTDDCGVFKLKYSTSDPQTFIIEGPLRLDLNQQIVFLAREAGIKVHPSFDFSSAFVKYLIRDVIPEWYWLNWGKKLKYNQKVIITVYGLSRTISVGDIKTLNMLINGFVESQLK